MDCRQRLEGEVIRREGTSSNHTKPKAFLLCYVPSPLFPAHWSLWIPYDGKSGRGTRIHVTGDALNGFQHDFDRGYDPRTDDRHPRLIQLGVVDASSLPQLAERVGPCLEGIDTRVLRACSAVEELSMAIPAPGSGTDTPQAHSRVQIQNYLGRARIAPVPVELSVAPVAGARLERAGEAAPVDGGPGT